MHYKHELRPRRARTSRVAAILALAAALPLRAEEPLRPTIRALAVPSPYRMSDAARAGTIRYRVTFDDARIERTWQWPQTGEQRVEHHDGSVLTICSDCGTESAPSPAELERHRAATRWLESDDRRIVALARAARGGSVDLRMRRLVRAVQERLSGAVDYRHFRSAREAFDERAGDCTEFAVLLAAAARAAGMPARLVAGVAYASRFVGTPHAFGPHMWVQVWDGGRWVSYDAGLGRFDAGHLALAVDDGSTAGLRGVLEAIAALRIVDAAGVVVHAAPR